MKAGYIHANLALEAAVPGFLEEQRRDARFFKAVAQVLAFEQGGAHFDAAFAEAWVALSQLCHREVERDEVLEQIEARRAFVQDPAFDIDFYVERYG